MNYPFYGSSFDMGFVVDTDWIFRRRLKLTKSIFVFIFGDPNNAISVSVDFKIKMPILTTDSS